MLWKLRSRSSHDSKFGAGDKLQTLISRPRRTSELNLPLRRPRAATGWTLTSRDASLAAGWASTIYANCAGRSDWCPSVDDGRGTCDAIRTAPSASLTACRGTLAACRTFFHYSFSADRLLYMFTRQLTGWRNCATRGFLFAFSNAALWAVESNRLLAHSANEFFFSFFLYFHKFMRNWILCLSSREWMVEFINDAIKMLKFDREFHNRNFIKCSENSKQS